MTLSSTDLLTPVDADIFSDQPLGAALEAVRVARELGSRYTIGGLLGRGGFATVWEVFDRAVNRRVAAKRFGAEAARVSGFYREMSALFRLDHPNIVGIVNLLDVSDTTRYLFLEYCPGGTLREAFRKARREGESIPLDRLARISVDLCRGLGYAHRLGLVHRDLKPENILFAASGPDGLPGLTKLADFGLVRTPRPGIDESLRLLSGTPAYIAPEQISGVFSRASDLYALGIVLYEGLHGRPPFEGPPESVAYQHVNRLPSINPALPEHWIEILQALLDKDPERRPSEMGWIIDRLAPRSRLEDISTSETAASARCLGVEASNVIADGDRGVVVPTRFGLFRFRGPAATRSGMIHISPSLSRSGMGDDAVLWLTRGKSVLTLAADDVEARFVFDAPSKIDDLAPPQGGGTKLAIRCGKVLREYDASENPPRLRWRRDLPHIATGLLGRLADGRLVASVNDLNPRIILLGSEGETSKTIDLPGFCQSLLVVGNGLAAKLRVGDSILGCRIDLEASTVACLDDSDGLIALAANPSKSDMLIGLFPTGEVVRWDQTGNKQHLGRFPRKDGRLLGLAISGGNLLGTRRKQRHIVVDLFAGKSSKLSRAPRVVEAPALEPPRSFEVAPAPEPAAIVEAPAPAADPLPAQSLLNDRERKRINSAMAGLDQFRPSTDPRRPAPRTEVDPLSAVEAADWSGLDGTGEPVTPEPVSVQPMPVTHSIPVTVPVPVSDPARGWVTADRVFSDFGD